MEKYAEKIADKNGWKIVEISLRATNAEKPNRRMFYEAGWRSFSHWQRMQSLLSANSYHGMILSVLYRRPVVVFQESSAIPKSSI